MNFIRWRLALCLAALSASAWAAPARDLTIYAGSPPASWRITLTDHVSEMTMSGASGVMPPSAKAPDRRVSATREGGALTLHFQNTGYAGLRIEGGKPVDLRPYVAGGVLALDINVKDLINGGLTFAIGCGEQCSRSLPYTLAARALAGKGWRHLVFSMRCFVREGDDVGAVAQPFKLDAGGNGEISVANVRYQASGQPNTSCPDYKTVSVTPDKLNEFWSIGWWTRRHEQKLAEAQALGKSADVVFIGDSITEGWEKSGAPVWQRYYKPMHGLVLGFGGDRTENVLWRLLHGEVDGLAPKVAVLLVGTNNTGHRQEDPQTTAAGIRRIVDELRHRLPDTRILLMAIFPRGENADDPLRRLNDKVNGVIAGFADRQHVYYLDINRAFLAADGTLSTDIMPDLLHPNESGYQIWAAAMAPTLEQLMAAAAPGR